MTLIDLSSDNAHPIDYKAVAGAGITGAFVKATQGTTYVNPFYEEDVAGLVAVGIPVVAYHFAEFTIATAEAAFFVRTAGSRARVLDSETNVNAAWQLAFLDALGLAADQEMDYGSASTLPRSVGVRSLLWPADYGRNPGFGDCWQSTDEGHVPGIEGDVDLSEWTGSTADFIALFNLAPPLGPQSPEYVYMIPSNCSDVNVVKAQIREWYADFWTIPLTAEVQNLYALTFATPTAQHGYGGNPDALLAGIIDGATKAGKLRPTMSGSA